MNLHILRPPKTTTLREKLQLQALDKYQRQYLKRFACALCEHPLIQTGCGSFYEACQEQTRITRRQNCLANYQPRPNRRKAKREPL